MGLANNEICKSLDFACSLRFVRIYDYKMKQNMNVTHIETCMWKILNVHFETDTCTSLQACDNTHWNSGIEPW